MIKLIGVADFRSHYFKEISSLSISVKQVLNKDSRLDINAPNEKHPNLNNVFQENQGDKDEGKQTSKQSS